MHRLFVILSLLVSFNADATYCGAFVESIPLPRAVENLLRTSLKDLGNPDALILPASVWKPLQKKYGYEGERGEYQFLMAVHAAATAFARPPISNYRVSNFILTSTKEIVFGVNLEFGDLRHTIHGEQFAFYRSLFRPGKPQALYVDGSVCGHCRQVMLEGEKGVRLGFNTSQGKFFLGDFLPDAFGPEILGAKGVASLSQTRFTIRRLDNKLLKYRVFDNTVAAAFEASTRAWSPYSRSPNGTSLEMRDGSIIQGVYLENVNFNASTPSFMGAIIEMVARGYQFSDIARVVYVEPQLSQDRATYRDAFKSLFDRFAPEAKQQLIELPYYNGPF